MRQYPGRAHLELNQFALRGTWRLADQSGTPVSDGATIAGRVQAAHVYLVLTSAGNTDVFVTKPSPFTELAVAAIAEVTGRTPKLSNSGGTSDARFIKNYCPVLEFGLVGQTMHQVDENVALADLTTLTAIYRRIIEKYFAAPPGALANQ